MLNRVVWVLCFLPWIGVSPLMAETRPNPMHLQARSEALAKSLRALLLQFLPSPLFEDDRHWGGQVEVDRIEWKGKGLKVHPTRVQVMKNDGVWWRVRVDAPQIQDRLTCEVTHLSQPEPGRIVFGLAVALDSAIEYERQRWEKGIRLFGGSTRARMRIKLNLNCEVTTHLEQTPKLVPNVVFRLRVLGSDASYDNLVFTHLPGIGGDAARILGDAVHSSLKQWKPSLERRLLDKANAAILRAADTREVTLSLSHLFPG